MGFFENVDDSTIVNNSLWVEKWRPRRLEDYVGNEHLKERIKSYLEEGDIPHLLLYGRAGTGKCLDGSEYIEIEMELSDDEIEMLSKFIVK